MKKMKFVYPDKENTSRFSARFIHIFLLEEQDGHILHYTTNQNWF